MNSLIAMAMQFIVALIVLYIVYRILLAIFGGA